MLNLKLRFKNKTVCTAILLQVLAIVYTVLRLLGIAPPVEQEAVEQLVLMGIELFSLLGIVVDPTTPGIEDSARALRRDEPGCD